jgi:hypothetical protein
MHHIRGKCTAGAIGSTQGGFSRVADTRRSITAVCIRQAAYLEEALKAACEMPVSRPARIPSLQHLVYRVHLLTQGT